MLVCPVISAADELLLQRPGLYLKTNLPLGGVVYFPKLPDNSNSNDFLGDLAWMVDSYLFKYNATRPLSHTRSTPRLYVDYANRMPSHGPAIFDDAYVIATPEARSALEFLNHRYSAELIDFITSHANEIWTINYAETSLLEEVCSHMDFIAESLNYVQAVARANPQLLAASKLTHGWEHITCCKKYNRVVLSFYLASIKELFPNSPGSYIGMFKNLYNVLEYLMEGEGKPHLCTVLRDRVGNDRLKSIICGIKTSAHPQSAVLYCLNNGERLSPNQFLPPISEDDTDLAKTIGERLYDTRNAVFHSKKTRHGEPIEGNVRPGHDEIFRLAVDLALIRPIAEIIVEELDPNE
jgi:hypothetical protein